MRTAVAPCPWGAQIRSRCGSSFPHPTGFEHPTALRRVAPPPALLGQAVLTNPWGTQTRSAANEMRDLQARPKLRPAQPPKQRPSLRNRSKSGFFGPLHGRLPRHVLLRSRRNKVTPPGLRHCLPQGVWLGAPPHRAPNHSLSFVRQVGLIRPPTGGSWCRFTSPERGMQAEQGATTISPEARVVEAAAAVGIARRGRSRSRPFRSRLTPCCYELERMGPMRRVAVVWRAG